MATRTPSADVNSIEESLLTLTVFIAAFADIYRYPLQYGASATSGSYTPAPIWLKSIDQLLIILLLLLFILVRLHRNGKLNRINIFFATAVLLVFSKAILTLIVDPSGSVVVSYIFIFGSLAIFLTTKHLTWLVDKVLSWLPGFFAFTTSFSLLQVMLFLFRGRPPARAWTTDPEQLLSPAVRFGSFWEAPNEYALFCVIIVLYALVIENRFWVRLFLIAAAIIQLLLTWSGTGVILMSVGFLVFGGVWITRILASSPSRHGGPVVALLLVVASTVGGIYLFQSELLGITRLLVGKPAIQTHIEDVLLTGQSLTALNFEAFEIEHFESSYSWIAVNVGIVPALFFVTVTVAPIVLRLKEILKSDRILIVWLVYLMVIVGSNGIPFLWFSRFVLLYFVFGLALIHGRKVIGSESWS